MNSLFSSADSFILTSLNPNPNLISASLRLPIPFFQSKPNNSPFEYRPRFSNAQSTCLCSIVASSAGQAEIDMVRTKEGVYALKPKKVVVLWDLDNKPPRGPPYQAAMALKSVAHRFGDVVDISAYANRHAFIHLPQWVIEERRERRHLEFLERKGLSTPSEPYVCSMCGRKCKTHMDLKRHFRQLHERERQKKLNRMKSLKGKKRLRFKERFVEGNHRYTEAARALITPKVGYGLASELRRAGVFVKTVKDKPQAADWALRRQMQHSMSRGIDWLFLVSDDSDFSEMLSRAREANLGTVVVGDSSRALGRHANLWVPWIGVENGEVSDKDLVPRTLRSKEFEDRSEQSFPVSHFDGELGSDGNLDSFVDELVGDEFGGLGISAFSEGEEEEEEEEIEDDWITAGRNTKERGLQISEFIDEAEDFMLDSEDEDA